MTDAASSDPALSVVIPVRDEETSLPLLHIELDAALGSFAGGCEFVFVDDASGDESLAVLRELQSKDPRVRVLALDRHEGQSAALAAGFRAARGALTATLDADLQNDPADLPRLAACLADDKIDVAQGVRAVRHDARHRRLVSVIANAVRRAVVRDGVRDVGCSLRVMRTPLLRRVKLYRGLHRFLPALLQLEGARIVQLEVSHRPRRYGRSKYGVVQRLLETCLDLLAVRWMMSRQLRARVHEEIPQQFGE